MTITGRARAVLTLAVAVLTLMSAEGYCQTLESGLAALKAGYQAMALPQLREARGILTKEAEKGDPSGVIHYHLARALSGLGIYYSVQGNADEAVRYLTDGVAAAELAVSRDPRSSVYRTTLGDVYGELAGQSGLVGKIRNGQRAEAAYTRAVELDPKNPLAHVGIGITKLEKPMMFGGSPDAALDEFRLAQRLDPRCDEAWVWEGVTLRRQGAVGEARRAFAHALQVNPESGHARRELAMLDEDFR
jgi:tetratricopeptide (TPR) repeat protein